MTLRLPADEYLHDRRKPLPAYLGGEFVITIASRPKWDGEKWNYTFVPVEGGETTQIERKVA